MKKKLKNMGKKVRFFGMCLVMNLSAVMLNCYPVFAGEAEDPIIVKGTRLLFAAFIAIATGLVTSLGTVNAFKVGAKWINASAEERSKYQKELINVIAATVVVLTIGSTITYIVGFYNS